MTNEKIQKWFNKSPEKWLFEKPENVQEMLKSKRPITFKDNKIFVGKHLITIRDDIY